jgi:hypothetical protein
LLQAEGRTCHIFCEDSGDNNFISSESYDTHPVPLPNTSICDSSFGSETGWPCFTWSPSTACTHCRSNSKLGAADTSPTGTRYMMERVGASLSLGSLRCMYCETVCPSLSFSPRQPEPSQSSSEVLDVEKRHQHDCSWGSSGTASAVGLGEDAAKGGDCGSLHALMRALALQGLAACRYFVQRESSWSGLTSSWNTA